MYGFGMADPAELAVLTRALDDYCAKHGIDKGPDRDDIAIRVMDLFRQGVIDPTKLSDGLDHMAAWIGPAR
ncbi:hypothetical protein RB623_00365 [Mesorhizobium sp. LHD-90]|uniref:hypothetical protein n=1 Tax=Mesorhizobium sp. LHD-90 TaxID=3071414 RepID=UPI0027DF7452|nr:hypothetical protein [Mesorhizobium sp. LHD-90]MDQ6432502.1 hypothetical protein [Mesorhizobium sp. LHD-90]